MRTALISLALSSAAKASSFWLMKVRYVASLNRRSSYKYYCNKLYSFMSSILLGQHSMFSVKAMCFRRLRQWGWVEQLQHPSTCSRPLRREQGHEIADRHGECPEDVDPVLSGGGDDRAHGCEDFGTGHGSEAAGDFHPQFHHPDVLLGLIVGERHLEILNET